MGGWYLHESLGRFSHWGISWREEEMILQSLLGAMGEELPPPPTEDPFSLTDY